MVTVKVNIGCGPQVVADWINYDSSLHIILSRYQFLKKILRSLRIISKQVYETNWPFELIRRIDLRKGIPLLDESVDFIYCSHFLEHLTYDSAVRLLKECHRVLRHEGLIRLVCPDLKLITSKYLQKDLNYILFNVSSKADLSKAFIRSLCLSDDRPVVERIFFPGSLHRFMYDFDSLEGLLTLCGFINIERREFKQGVTPDIDRLDNRPEESLYVEAQKS